MWCIAIRLMTVRFPAITLMVSLKMISITWHPFLNIGQPGTGRAALHSGAYLMKVRAHQYDTVDALCWRHYGRTQGVTEQVLKANPGLAEYGPFLPHGLQVELPDIPTTTTVQTVQLWD